MSIVEEEVDEGSVQAPPSSKTESSVGQPCGDPDKSTENETPMKEHGEQREAEESSETPSEGNAGSEGRQTETENRSEGERGELDDTARPTEPPPDVEKSQEETTATGLSGEAESEVTGEDDKTTVGGEVCGGEEREREGEGGGTEVGGEEEEKKGEGEEREVGGKESGTEEKESKKVEPIKLLLSIPFHHIKFKRGRGLSPCELTIIIAIVEGFHWLNVKFACLRLVVFRIAGCIM